MPPEEDSLRSIDLEAFARRLHDTHTEKRFALFLGAGCSVTSGIPSAGQLVSQRWLPHLRKLHAPDRSDLEAWAGEVIPGYDPKNPALSYGALIDRLFLTPDERQQEIENLCDGRTPSFGYAALAQLMTEPAGRFNVVLTTNFDDLVADALYLYTGARPLVIPHESLASFIRSTRTRPLIVKLHGDHRLSPKNTALETQELAQEFQNRATMLLRDRGVIFMGYSGNDESILNLLNGLPHEALPSGAYWVHSREPQGKIRGWLLARQGIWVKSGQFDEVMLSIRNEFNFPHPDVQRFVRIFDEYQKRLGELKKLIESKSQDDPGVQALKQAISNTEALFTGPWKVMSEAYRLERQDPIRADEIYRQGITQFPNAAPLLGSYAFFLKDTRKDYDAAEAMYKRALEVDPKHAINLGNYASFLYDIRKDYDAAEAMYKRALEADPKDANTLGNYANFLYGIRKGYDAAEAMYQRALEADPKDANNLGNYARLLLADGRSHDGLAFLERAEKALPKTGRRPLELECAFYRFAHGSLSDQKAALRNIKKLVDQGVRLPGWDLSRNVDRALSDGHPEGPWLSKLARVVNGDAQPDLLNDWPAWR